MNKQDWIYKKLGDECSILYGYPFDSKCFSTSPDDMPLIRIRDVKEGKTSTFYNGDYPKNYIIHKGDYLIGMDGEFNISPWQSEDALLNQRVCKISCNTSSLLIRYVYRFLIKELKKIEDETPFVTVKHLSAKKINQINIPVPPVAEQERIVAELDLLSGIIEKKKEQLKAYDQLAQSIFYTMFGDPIDNPKGWETKTMSDVCASMTKGPFGSDIKKSLFVPKSKDTYKVYIQANAIEKDISLGDYYISKDYFENKMFRFEVKPNDYIITCDGTLGKYIRLPQCIERGIISASLLRLTLNDNINYRYFEHLWDYYILHQQIKDIRNTALKHLPSASKMGKTTIPLPPISLQEEFAEKVEAIERQKALVQQSIEETQTMFDCTMDKYFG